jgi:hypothetical protein
VLSVAYEKCGESPGYGSATNVIKKPFYRDRFLLAQGVKVEIMTMEEVPVKLENPGRKEKNATMHDKDKNTTMHDNQEDPHRGQESVFGVGFSLYTTFAKILYRFKIFCGKVGDFCHTLFLKLSLCHKLKKNIAGN